MDDSRLRRLGVSWELMRIVFAPGNVIPACKVIADGIPKDAKLTGITYDGVMTIWLTIWSSEFTEVPQGEEIPVMNTSFETVQMGAMA